MLREVSISVATPLAGVAVQAMAAEPAPMPLDQAAKIFGARPSVAQMSLSPDGKNIAYIGAAAGQASVLFVGDLATGDLKPATYTDNKPLDLKYCAWSANDRLVCQSYGLDLLYGKRVSYSRLFSIDGDGKNLKPLAVPAKDAQHAYQYDGKVVDWLDRSGQVLIARYHVPTQTTGTMLGHNEEGFGVDLVDTRTNNARVIEHARAYADRYISDGKGNIRIIGYQERGGGGVQLSGREIYQYRTGTSGAWVPFSTDDGLGRGTRPIAVDGGLNAAYVRKPKDGRLALYRVALDGSMKEELLIEHPRVDVSGLLMIGNNHVIGGYYFTDREIDVYFDPAYRTLAQQLGRALPKTPLIEFVDASTDEDVLLIRASSDTDEGRFYIFQKSTHALHPLLPVRPEADGRTFANVQVISYKSFDGTEVPAYLTLPPGSSGKNLPTIVMPHGGPADRDVWGFDWLPQFFASRGFAVLQPEFRGSTGYGEAWFVSNGFQSWRTAIGDVNGAGKWLIAQGIADPARLAVVGWSYGGYAALQANVLDPDLFKAVVAVAPVTDLAMLRRESEGFTNEAIEKAYIGAGPLLEEASPARHAAAFKVPVLLFHGTRDVNVGFAESQAMDDALHRAGKQSILVRYPDLDHQLADSGARADLLTQADTFLRKVMKM